MIDMETVQFGDVHQAAKITGISASTLVKHRLYNPELSPPFAKVGRRVLYPLSGPNSVATWIEKRLVVSGVRISVQ